MSEQHALWVDPHWTERWQAGDTVVSEYTANTGEVVEVITGRHLLIKWGESYRDPNGHTARHSSELGLVRA